MSQRITQPVQSIKLTNVAVVRLVRHKKRFEIACYRNKVMNYRQGLETDLDEVLQSDRIFTNVSKGEFASFKLLQQVFGTTNEVDVARIILDKGQFQLSDLERKELQDNATREICQYVVANCVEPLSQRPYTTTQIQHAMQEAEFQVNLQKPIKPQCLACVKALQRIIPIERAKMELTLKECNDDKTVTTELQEMGVANIKQSDDKIVVLIDPSLYRQVHDFTKRHGGRLEITRQVVTQEGDVNLTYELQRKQELQEMQQALEQVSLDNEQEEAAAEVIPRRAQQKKKQKQSKKAKRREKQEAAERQARIDAEKQRQEERKERLGEGEAAVVVSNSKQDVTVSNDDGLKSCNTCGGSFDASQYRAHFRSDWHRYNLKLKLKGAPAVSEQEFVLCDSDAFFEER